MTAEQVFEGETRQEGYLYFVKGDDLMVFKTKMSRGGKKKVAKK